MKQFRIGIIDATSEFKHEGAGSICAPLLPFAGNFRLIDFVLSNFSNAHINHLYLSLPDRCHSLVSYIGGGEAWHYGKSPSEIKYLPSIATAKADWKKNLYGLPKKEVLVILTKGTTVCNISIENYCRTHIHGLSVLTHKNIPIGVYILSLELLFELLEKSREVDSMISLVSGYMENGPATCVEIDGYGRDINSIESFYQANMEILWPARMKSLLFQKDTIYPKDFDYHPTVYGAYSRVVNSLVGQGCMIEGTIENSVIFPNCRVEKDVIIRNCIVMEDSIIKTGKFEQTIYSPSFIINNMLTKGIS